MTASALRAVAIATALGGFLGACASGTNAPPPMMPPSPAEMRVSYACDNGESVDVRYFPQQGIGVLIRGGQDVELQAASTPPGFTYSSGQTTLRVAPDRLSMTMNVGMMATATCKAR